MPDTIAELQKAYENLTRGHTLPVYIETTGEALNFFLRTADYTPEKWYAVTAEGITEIADA
jgi:hypothetical protein